MIRTGRSIASSRSRPAAGPAVLRAARPAAALPAAFLVAALAPAMAARGQGAIVSISTMVASFGQPGMATYGASRAALELLTKAWAAEYGPRGVRVNAVALGPTRTPMNDAYGDMPSGSRHWHPPAASPNPRRSPPPSPTSPATKPASSTAPPSPSTAAAPPPEPSQPTPAAAPQHRHLPARSKGHQPYPPRAWTVRDARERPGTATTERHPDASQNCSLTGNQRHPRLFNYPEHSSSECSSSCDPYSDCPVTRNPAFAILKPR